MELINRTETGPGPFSEIHDAIQSVKGRPLKHWLALGVWDDDDGDGMTLMSDGSVLELRGHLLDAVYASSHWSDPDEDGEAVALDDARDVRRFEGGRMDVVTVGSSAIGRGRFDPGWRWTEVMSSIVGTELCPLSHVGYVVEGRMGFKMADGSEFEASAGDAIHVAPGHDAWTIGDEPCVILEVRSADTYGQRAAPKTVVAPR